MQFSPVSENIENVCQNEDKKETQNRVLGRQINYLAYTARVYHVCLIIKLDLLLVKNVMPIFDIIDRLSSKQSKQKFHDSCKAFSFIKQYTG